MAENQGADSQATLSSAEVDAIGEILNISMGSAATAISTLLDRQVSITTPNVTLKQFENIDYSTLEPAMLVKIEYVEGISGSNVMLFRQNDMQVILNLLMGNDDPPEGKFVFDELSMSAACEVMNQMMGASATALSEFLGKTINISTPTTFMVDSQNTFQSAMGVDDEEEVVSVAFDIKIDGVMNSEFASVMTLELAKMIVSQAMGEQEQQTAAAPPPPPRQAPPQMQQQAPPMQQMPAQPPQQQAPPMQMPQQQTPPMQMPAQQQSPQMQQQAEVQPQYQQPEYQQPAYYEQPLQANMQYPQQQYQQQYQQPQYPQQQYQQPQMGYQPLPVIKTPVNVQNVQLPDFSKHQAPVFVQPLSTANMDLIMNVPLNVSVEIGKTKRKIREIMDFNQGTVIELEKQAGAPVDIVVNGQLIARGDVVVIDDNFGVRITEILGTRELIEAIDAAR